MPGNDPGPINFIAVIYGLSRRGTIKEPKSTYDIIIRTELTAEEYVAVDKWFTARQPADISVVRLDNAEAYKINTATGAPRLIPEGE